MNTFRNNHGNMVTPLPSANGEEIEMGLPRPENNCINPGANAEIENERIEKLLKSDQRNQVYKNILFNKPASEVPYYTAVYGFVGIVLGIVVTSVYILIPVHNVIEEPKYWYVGMTG